MDPRIQSSKHLKPPSSSSHHHHHHQGQRTTSSSSSSSSHSPSPPRPPLTASSSATIADSVIFQGHHAITIGAGTIIHPRARIYSYDGPLSIGEGVIIGEKAVIGTLPSSSTSTTTTTTSPLPTRISNAVTIAPQATILPGAHIHSATTIESLAVVNQRANIGSHCRIGAGCEIPEAAHVADWTVVWGSPGSTAGYGQRRRKRTVGKVVPSVIVAGPQAQEGSGLEGRVIEDARLTVLAREREALVRLLGPGAAARRR